MNEIEKDSEKNNLIDKYWKIVFKQSFAKNINFLILLIGGFVLNVIFLLLIFLGIKSDGNILQTGFNSFFGVIDTGGLSDFYMMYFVGLMVYVVNTALAIFIYEKDRIISFFLLSVSILAQILLIFQIVNFIKLINI